MGREWREGSRLPEGEEREGGSKIREDSVEAKVGKKRREKG